LTLCNVGDDPPFRETADGQSDCCDVAGHQDPGSHPEAPALPSLPLSHTTIILIAALTPSLCGSCPSSHAWTLHLDPSNETDEKMPKDTPSYSPQPYCKPVSIQVTKAQLASIPHKPQTTPPLPCLARASLVWRRCHPSLSLLRLISSKLRR
jgi:hypothetical protein